MNAPDTGFYSLLQYCPDRSRMEAANVGVVLFCPGQQYLRVRTAAGNDRVRRFFGEEAGDLKQLNAMKRMFENWLEVEAPEIRDLAALRRFGSLLANELILTEPRPVRIEEPDAELAQLFEDLVSGRAPREPGRESHLAAELHHWLGTPALRAKVQRDVEVMVPKLGLELKAPYAYQNGRFNLIVPHEFTQQREKDVLRDACKTAVEGSLLYRHPDADRGARQLVIVADFHADGQKHKRQVEEVLREHDVVLYDESSLDRLAAHIAATAH